MNLLGVPAQDLLLSQRINKTWQAATVTSQRLQRKLSFTADLIKDGSLDFHHHFQADWNPLLKPFMMKKE